MMIQEVFQNHAGRLRLSYECILLVLKFIVDYSRMLTVYYNPTALYMSARSITPAVSNRLHQQNGLLMSAIHSIFFSSTRDCEVYTL